MCYLTYLVNRQFDNALDALVSEIANDKESYMLEAQAAIDRSQLCNNNDTNSIRILTFRLTATVLELSSAWLLHPP